MKKQRAKIRPKVQISCKRCGKTYFVAASLVDRGAGVFCSLECFKGPKVQRVCKECGVEFLIPQRQAHRAGRGTYCSKECFYKPNAESQRTCETCGREFAARKQNRKGKDPGFQKFCSRECYPNNEKPKLTTVCGWCGKVFASLASRKQKFCSNKCGCLNRKKAGIRKTRRYELQGWARKVILRDKACVRCGATENLQAHHVKSLQKHPELGLDIDNGVALCGVCHHFHHPKLPLRLFLGKGKSVKRCLYCESPFVQQRTTQRACSKSCGDKIRRKPRVT